MAKDFQGKFLLDFQVSAPKLSHPGNFRCLRNWPLFCRQATVSAELSGSEVKIFLQRAKLKRPEQREFTREFEPFVILGQYKPQKDGLRNGLIIKPCKWPYKWTVTGVISSCYGWSYGWNSHLFPMGIDNSVKHPNIPQLILTPKWWSRSRKDQHIKNKIQNKTYENLHHKKLAYFFFTKFHEQFFRGPPTPNATPPGNKAALLMDDGGYWSLIMLNLWMMAVNSLLSCLTNGYGAS